MERDAVCWVMLMLLVVNVLALCFDVQLAGATTIVVPDQYPTIQEAIDAAAAGDTILVLNGTYPESPVINKSLSLIGESCNGTLIKGNINIRSNNVEVSGFRVQDGRCGIYIDSSSGCTISSNYITSCDRGLFLAASSNNNIVGNTVTENSYLGAIFLCRNSNNNTITENRVIKNHHGIWVDEGCSYNKIANNTIYENNNGGIWLAPTVLTSSHISSGNTIISNVMSNNGLASILIQNIFNNTQVIGNRLMGTQTIGICIGEQFGAKGYPSNAVIMNNTVTTVWGGGCEYGIYIDADSNDVVGNTVMNCEYGVHFLRCRNQMVHHNNFIHNTRQASVTESHNIKWDDGCEGNYWSDYNGTDLCSSHFQNKTGSDGIGDTPYVINENNTDNYPLMGRWSPAGMVVNAPVGMDPEMLNLKSIGRWFTSYIELEVYNVSDINVTSIMLNDTIPVDPDAPTSIGDYDNDTIPDLAVNFNRTTVREYLLSQNITYGNVALTITGIVKEKPHTVIFEGSNILKVSSLIGDVDCDGEVCIYDIVSASVSYGSKQGEKDWNPNCDCAPLYGRIDIYDIVTMAYHYGEIA